MEKNILISHVANNSNRTDLMYAAADYFGGRHYSPCYYYGVGGIKAILAQHKIDLIVVVMKNENSCEEELREDLKAFLYEMDDERYMEQWSKTLSAESRGRMERVADTFIADFCKKELEEQIEDVNTVIFKMNDIDYLMRTANEALNSNVAFSTDELSYLSYMVYRKLPGRNKIQCRADNVNAEIQFLLDAEDDSSIEKSVMNFLTDLSSTENKDDINNIWIYDAAIDSAYSYVQLNMTKAISEQVNNLNIKGIFSNVIDDEVVVVQDRTKAYELAYIYEALRTFTKYGKADVLVDILSEEEADETIASMIYAMRMVDDGVSLCDIDSIIEGFERIKALIKTEHNFENPMVQLIYYIIVFSIKNSYGKLMEGDGIDCFELVKWANDRGMYQQALTIIEAKIPEDMVRRGIYYYVDETSNIDELTEKFAVEYSWLKPFERYKITDSLNHYYIKTYPRTCKGNKGTNRGAGRDITEKQKQLLSAQFSVSLINTEDSSLIKAYTKCSDLDSLRDAYFAYNHAGIVRNRTNHAAESGGDIDISQDETRLTQKKKMVTEALDFFINKYEIVRKQVEGADYIERKLEKGTVIKRGKEIRDERHKSEKEKGENNGK